MATAAVPPAELAMVSTRSVLGPSGRHFVDFGYCLSGKETVVFVFTKVTKDGTLLAPPRARVFAPLPLLCPPPGVLFRVIELEFVCLF